MLFQGAHDLALIFGSFIAAIVITISATYAQISQPPDNQFESEIISCTAISDNFTNCSSVCFNCTEPPHSSPTEPILEAFMDKIFDTDEHGHRLCGASACVSSFVLNFNNYTDPDGLAVLPKKTTVLLSGTFAVLSGLALGIAVAGLGRVRTYVCQDSVGSWGCWDALTAVWDTFRDAKLKLAAPLALFIGLEQGFIYTGFGKVSSVCKI